MLYIPLVSFRRNGFEGNWVKFIMHMCIVQFTIVHAANKNIWIVFLLSYPMFEFQRKQINFLLQFFFIEWYKLKVWMVRLHTLYVLSTLDILIFSYVYFIYRCNLTKCNYSGQSKFMFMLLFCYVFFAIANISCTGEMRKTKM